MFHVFQYRSAASAASQSTGSSGIEPARDLKKFTARRLQLSEALSRAPRIGECRRRRVVHVSPRSSAARNRMPASSSPRAAPATSRRYGAGFRPAAPQALSVSTTHHREEQHQYADKLAQPASSSTKHSSPFVPNRAPAPPASSVPPGPARPRALRRQLGLPAGRLVAVSTGKLTVKQGHAGLGAPARAAGGRGLTFLSWGRARPERNRSLVATAQVRDSFPYLHAARSRPLPAGEASSQTSSSCSSPLACGLPSTRCAEPLPATTVRHSDHVVVVDLGRRA